MSEDFVEYPCARCGKSRPGLEEPCSECGWKPYPIEKRTTFRRHRYRPSLFLRRYELFLELMVWLLGLPPVTLLGLVLSMAGAVWILFTAPGLKGGNHQVLPLVVGGVFQLFSGLCVVLTAEWPHGRPTPNHALMWTAVVAQLCAVSIGIWWLL